MGDRLMVTVAREAATAPLAAALEAGAWVYPPRPRGAGPGGTLVQIAPGGGIENW
jgi:hypothetical protein